MLKFDIQKTPPTAAQIEAERSHLQSAVKKLKTRSLAMFLLAMLIFFGGLAALYGTGTVSGKEIFVAVVGAAVVAAFCAIVGAIVGAVGAAAGASVVAAAAIGAAAVCATVCGCGIIIQDRADNHKKQLSSLIPLSDADKTRGPKILEICRKNAQCESYRLAVAQMDRPLIVAEGDMIEEWVADTDKRQAEDEQRQAAEQACRLLESKETM